MKKIIHHHTWSVPRFCNMKPAQKVWCQYLAWSSRSKEHKKYNMHKLYYRVKWQKSKISKICQKFKKIFTLPKVTQFRDLIIRNLPWKFDVNTSNGLGGVRNTRNLLYLGFIIGLNGKFQKFAKNSKMCEPSPKLVSSVISLLGIYSESLV